MYLPKSPDVGIPDSTITTSTSYASSRFTLGISGVLGFFGGDEAISAIATVPVYKGRRWLGWYNTPGSYQIAKKYGPATALTIFKGLFPGTQTDPTKVFGFDGWQGPKFRAIYSGTILDSTGHLASVLMKECAALRSKEEISRRQGSRHTVTVVTLNAPPAGKVTLQRSNTPSTLFSIFPIAVSVVACIASGAFGDWFSLFSILLGMVCNGVFCLVVGSGTVQFTHNMAAPGSPPGDGILDAGKEFVVLRGKEDAVNSITRGKLSLELGGKSGDGYIGYCSFFFIIQFIAQLLLIPQASLFGQIMFISTFAVSWIYNSWPSFDRERIQRHILRRQVFQSWERPLKYTFDSRTAAVVFALLVLLRSEQNTDDDTLVDGSTDGQDDGLNYPVDGSIFPTGSPLSSTDATLKPLFSSPQNYNSRRGVAKKMLQAYLPHNTDVWKKWIKTVLEQLRKTGELQFKDNDWNVSGLAKSEKELLETLFHDAEAAYEVFEGFISPQPGESPDESAEDTTGFSLLKSDLD